MVKGSPLRITILHHYIITSLHHYIITSLHHYIITSLHLVKYTFCVP